MELELPGLWNDYVPKHLLPRIHGYELMMAPYAIAHMKIGLKLAETGYRFGSDERARVYLTNTLEQAKDVSGYLTTMAPALAHESHAANTVKRSLRATVVIGNPPYSGRSWNLTPEIRKIVEPYRFVAGTRIREKGALQLEKSIQEDYIKFIRYAQIVVERTGVGVVGFVTSHGFLDNPTLRGVRHSLLQSFRPMHFVDLHGNVSRGDQSPDGSADENVFDIKKTGAAISLLVRSHSSSDAASVCVGDLWGTREAVKYPWLLNNTTTTAKLHTVQPSAAFFLFVLQNLERKEEYERGYSIAEILPLHSKGIVTGRDAFVSDFNERPLLGRMSEFVDVALSDQELIDRYNLNPSDWWNVHDARQKMPAVSKHNEYIEKMLYRPFDFRVCFYHPAVFMSPRRPVMQHFGPQKPNLLLITSRMTKGETFAHVTVSRGLTEAILLSSKTSNNAIIFPLYIYEDTGPESLAFSGGAKSAFTDPFLSRIGSVLHMQVLDVGKGDLQSTVGTEDLLCYILSILHSANYRQRYQEFLKRDFPRIPLTENLEFFRRAVCMGNELLALHLLESPLLGSHITTLVGSGDFQVEKVTCSNETVWIDKAKTRGFQGVPEEVWNFHIGGYRVCEKWLKDRQAKGGKHPRPCRVLTAEDIDHYQRIVVALAEIIRIMAEIDEVIDQHGGWPDAFVTEKDGDK